MAVFKRIMMKSFWALDKFDKPYITAKEVDVSCVKRINESGASNILINHFSNCGLKNREDTEDYKYI